ncbi:tigger transposable element-derived protein 6-like [Gigantopelta aegis]|uniref:tigger transposable element-derived protein 6-like n=1 Tax=Gigantopelta aegis TaxID=1735272 RepID=UPI001B887E88|nr:tigger transposable element-derived protein 6-like [Gigantopelta aegis]
MASQQKKRKRHEITAFEKREICQYKLTNTKASLDSMSKHFGNTFGHEIRKSTIGDILKNKEKWLKIAEDEASLSRARNAKNQNDFNPEVYVRYRNNKKAWMSSDLFCDWLRAFDRQMKSRGQHVILLVDNAASHSCKDTALSHVKVHFLPPNTTAHIQPMDGGIISAFKAHYRRYLVWLFLKCVEDGEAQVVNLRQALRFVKQSWGEVTSATIRNCYKHVDILPNTDDDDEDDLVLSELRDLLKSHQNSADEGGSVLTAEEYVDADIMEETGRSLTDGDILQLVGEQTTPEPAEPSDDDDNDVLPQPAPSANDARQHIESLKRYFETTGDESNLELVLKMQMLFESNCSVKQPIITEYFIKH